MNIKTVLRNLILKMIKEKRQVKQDLEKAIHFIEMIIERDYATKEIKKETKPTPNSWGINK